MLYSCLRKQLKHTKPFRVLKMTTLIFSTTKYIFYIFNALTYVNNCTMMSYPRNMQLLLVIAVACLVFSSCFTGIEGELFHFSLTFDF